MILFGKHNNVILSSNIKFNTVIHSTSRSIQGRSNPPPAKGMEQIHVGNHGLESQEYVIFFPLRYSQEYPKQSLQWCSSNTISANSQSMVSLEDFSFQLIMHQFPSLIYLLVGLTEIGSMKGQIILPGNFLWIMDPFGKIVMVPHRPSQVPLRIISR